MVFLYIRVFFCCTSCHIFNKFLSRKKAATGLTTFQMVYADDFIPNRYGSYPLFILLSYDISWADIYTSPGRLKGRVIAKSGDFDPVSPDYFKYSTAFLCFILLAINSNLKPFLQSPFT